MPVVNFHYNVPDKLAYATRLVRKAYAQGFKLAVVGPAEDLQALDARLWTCSDTDFLAHAAWPAEAAVWRASPIVLCDRVEQSHHREVLLNLGASVPEGFEAFARFNDLVTRDEAARQTGRQRWAHYKALGLHIERHEVAG